MKKIAVKRLDGGVSIVIPTNEATPELLLRDALAVDGYVSHRDLEDLDIPSDRVFRNAWTDNLPGTQIDIDMPKAHLIKKDQMRALRKPKLEALDVEFMLALEAGDSVKQQDIASKKQELRDVTKLVLPETVDELKAFMPIILQ